MILKRQDLRLYNLYVVIRTPNLTEVFLLLAFTFLEPLNCMFTSTLLKHSMTTGVASLIVSMVCVSSPSYAQVINGSFETGTFSGFNRRGVTTIETAAFGSGPTQGNFQALITNEEGSVTTPDLEVFLGLTPGSLQNTSGGSAISQTFTTNAGGILTFDFNFITNETAPPVADDFSFFTLNNSVTTLAGRASATSPSNTTEPRRFEAETGFQTRSLLIPSAGTFNLGFGVVDATTDSTVDSGLLLENIQLQAIPEPSSIFGLLTFAAFSAGAILKRKWRKC